MKYTIANFKKAAGLTGSSFVNLIGSEREQMIIRNANLGFEQGHITMDTRKKLIVWANAQSFKSRGQK